MENYTIRERNCKAVVFPNRPVWHLFTNGKTSQSFLNSVDNYRFAMNLLARCAFEVPENEILAFALMSNHVHIIISGQKKDIEESFNLFKRRLHRYLCLCGHPFDRIEMTMKIIESETSLRNNIIYVHRNSYVVNPEHTPFSYPWSTGRYYFNDIPLEKRVSDLSVLEKREVFKTRQANIPSDWMMIDGYVAPPSFCNIALGKAAFKNAHQYFTMLGKSVESYSELACDIDDEEFLTDSELFTQISRIVRSRYNLQSFRDLSKAQKFDIAKVMRFTYRSSNGQIRRLTGLSQYEVDAIFPGQ